MSDNTTKRLDIFKSHLGPPKAPPPHVVIAKEREDSLLTREDIRLLTYCLDGGREETELKERFMLEFERDLTFKCDDIHDLTKDQARERTMEKVIAIANYLQSESVEVFTKRMAMVSVFDPTAWTRLGVHYGLFVGALRGSATPEQLNYWIRKGSLSLSGMYGCFCMTELAHGSNVAGLETTATFDPKADEFVIHTPSISATKWWIGGAAHSATHGAVFAQLIVDGKRYGVKSFIVPLRDTKSFALKQGVSIGDIGKKMGRDGIDNGWIQFTNVRIPRSYMLMKHTKVTRDGKVIEPALAQLTYGALLTGRTSMVVDAGNTAKKALTIAIRYAVVRRQFASEPGALETKILDYNIHQKRLMPLLATAVAMGFTGLEMLRLFDTMSQKLEASDGASEEELVDILEILKETHATSAGLKAFYTWSTLRIIDVCRQSIGGHGYSSYTGLAAMYSDYAVQATWEGDNMILALQAGRYLINCYREARSGKKMPSGVAYLNSLESFLTAKCPRDTTPEQAIIARLDIIQEAWYCIAANTVKKAAEDFEKCLENGMNQDQAFEHCSPQRFAAARIHSHGYTFRKFREAIERDQNLSKIGEEILYDLAVLYGIHSIEENAGAFLQYGYFTPTQMDFLRARSSQLCAKLRKYAVVLTDAFNFSDFIINSPFGRYDGNVYEAYFDLVKRNNPPQREHPYFNRLIKPFMTRNDVESFDDEELDIDEEISEAEKEANGNNN